MVKHTILTGLALVLGLLAALHGAQAQVMDGNATVGIEPAIGQGLMDFRAASFPPLSQTVSESVLPSPPLPTITCAADKIVECGSAWSFDPPNAAGGCSNLAVTVMTTVTNAGACAGTFSATRTWQASDACGQLAACSQTVTVVDTTPPVITCAPDKTVHCSEFWDFDPPAVTDNCGQATVVVVSTISDNPCALTYSITQTWQATDACGNPAQCSQTITVRTFPIINFVGQMELNRQSGLFEQMVVFANHCYCSTQAVQLTMTNPLPAGVVLWNASGTNAGLPYVQHNPFIPQLTTVTIRLEYYLTNRLQIADLTNNPTGTFNPGFVLVPAPSNYLNPPVGTNALMITGIRQQDGTYIVEFESLANRFYYIQYSSDPFAPAAAWQTAQPIVPGNGSRVQWIDSGPPKTESFPTIRFYRIALVPQP